MSEGAHHPTQEQEGLLSILCITCENGVCSVAKNGVCLDVFCTSISCPPRYALARVVCPVVCVLLPVCPDKGGTSCLCVLIRVVRPVVCVLLPVCPDKGCPVEVPTVMLMLKEFTC